MTEAQKATRRIRRETTAAMKALGTYREQFDPAIAVYAEMRYQLAEMSKRFFDGDIAVVEEYTNKAGATNERKTAEYTALEQLRRDVAAAEDRLGLNPMGMKRINEAEMRSRKKVSKLTSALEAMTKAEG